MSSKLSAMPPAFRCSADRVLATPDIRRTLNRPKYDGLPFPARMLVAQHATPGGRLRSGEAYVGIQYTFDMLSGIPECVHHDVESRRSIRAKDLEYMRIDDALEPALNHPTSWERTVLPSRQELGSSRRLHAPPPDNL